MRTLSVLGLTILSLVPLSSFAQSADPEPSQAPGANEPPPVAPPPPVAAEPAPPPPAPPPPPPAPAPPPAPVSSQPPINITITNTNTNTNPVTTTTTNTNTNPHTNTNTSTNTNTNAATATATVTAAPPPSVVAPSAPPGVFERYTLSAPTRSAPWITLGAIAGDHALGARGSIDLITRGAWALGIAGSITGDGGHGRGGGGPDRGPRGDRGGPDRQGHGRGTATVYLARTGSIRGFDVRAQLGIGVELGDAGGNDGSMNVARTTTGTPTPPDGGRRGSGRAAPIAQAAFLVGRPLSAHWGIAAGPIVTATGKGSAGQDAHPAPVDVTLFAGLRYRL